MKKKTKLVLLILFIFILLIFIFNNNDNINYEIKKDKNIFKITESLLNNNIYIEIKIDKKIYPLKIFDSRDKKVVTDIYYYKDKKYECIVPIINDKIYTDGMCYKDNELLNLSTINNKSLLSFKNEIKEYSEQKFLDNKSQGVKKGTITLYNSNKIKKSTAISTYKGLYNNGTLIDIFTKDVYENKLNMFIEKYYITADYNSTYTFNKFYIIDLDTNKKSEIKSKYDISFDSYIQGVIEDIIYLYDIDNEKQYTIDIKNNKIKLIRTEKIKHYQNGKWEEISISKANKKVLFDYTSLDDPFKNYDKLLKNDSLGIYYIIKKQDNKYDVYLSYRNNINLVKNILSITTNDIYIKDEYIYYVEDNKLYYYSEKTGLRTILKNTEFEFNNTIKFYIY